MEVETELQMARRHVALGTAHVKRQREIVAALQGRGETLEMALSLLAEFEDSMRQHQAHLERLQAKEAGGGT